MSSHIEEPRIARLRRLIEEQYAKAPTGCGGSFGEILCYEIHSAEETFISLCGKWGVSLPTLGELIWDHCCRLESDPVVKHEVRRAECSGSALRVPREHSESTGFGGPSS